MSTAVRPATVDDAEAIAAVRFASWRAAYGELVPAAFFEEFDHAAAIARWRAGMTDRDRRALVAERDGAVVGFCTYGPCRDADRADAAEIYAIYALPEHWSSGVGRGLIGAALQELRGRPVVLWVLRDNARARRFYEIAGLVVDGTARDTTMLGGVSLPEVRYRLP
ncbi:MAG TPA: GNAT family N-acetyltransferase [Jatrophihabitantaceae bacterium]|jgi:GNAT superfamily N-acetyltransferase